MNLKNWWENLLDRERQLITVCGVVVGILFIYGVIWSPLSDAVADRETEVSSQRQLLSYLKKSSVEIQQLKASGIQVNSVGQTDLLSLAEQTISQQGFSDQLKQVKQLKPNQIALTFENVSFDKLVQWIQMLATTQGVRVDTFNATRLPVVGAANVQVTLSS